MTERKRTRHPLDAKVPTVITDQITDIACQISHVEKFKPALREIAMAFNDDEPVSAYCTNHPILDRLNWMYAFNRGPRFGGLNRLLQEDNAKCDVVRRGRLVWAWADSKHRRSLASIRLDNRLPRG